MPRQAREITYQESNCFHVLVQGIAKSYIFSSDLDKRYYLKIISEKRKVYGISLLSFCVMDNHAHVLIYAEEKMNITKFFHEVNIIYAKFYNRERRRVGYVFRERFKAEAITEEKYLVNCISYIHLNPVKAGMTEKAEEYEFSSESNYITRTGIIDFDALKKVLGHVPETKACEFEFIEDEYEGKLELGEAIEAAMIKLQVKDLKELRGDDILLRNFVDEIQKNVKISLRELALVLEINREYIRKAVSKNTSP